MATCVRCGKKNPKGNYRCDKCGEILPPIEHVPRSEKRKWRKEYHLLYTTTTVDWSKEDKFVETRYTSRYIRPGKTRTYGMQTWLLINTGIILLLAGFGILFLVGWESFGKPGLLWSSAMLFLYAVIVAIMFYWGTFVPPKE